jgi:hypothetical protein
LGVKLKPVESVPAKPPKVAHEGSSRPKESEFYLPVLYLLGKLSCFKPFVGVSHEKIQDDVLRLAGYELEYDHGGTAVSAVDAKGNKWPLRSTNSETRDGLYRVVHFAWYHQTSRYRKGRARPALCGKAFDGEMNALRIERNALLDVSDDEDEVLRTKSATTRKRRAIQAQIEAKKKLLSAANLERVEHLEEEIRLVMKEGRGIWALTECGVREARELRAEYEGKLAMSCGPNATAKYLGENYDRLRNRITLHLRRKMPRSDQFDKIDDHASTWIERIIARDGLRKRLEEGRTIAPSQACAWARRSAYTDIRNDGREPVCRVFHGALTKPEIGTYDPSNWTTEVMPRTINEGENLLVNTYTEHSEDDHVGDMIDNLVDDHPSSSVENAMLNSDAFDHVLGRLAKIIHEELDDSQDPAFHEQLVHDRYVKEMTLSEIAEAHGLTKKDEDRVNLALNRVRDLMLRAREEGVFDEFLTR